jgi:hypothetical protein
MLNEEANISSLGAFFKELGAIWRKKIHIFLYCMVAGVLIGAAIGYLKPVKYKAELAFAAEEEGVSAFEGLMAQFGLDLGGSNSSGVFQGEALLKVFQTRNMVERALLEEATLDGKKATLAEYIFPTTKFASKEAFKDVHFFTDRSKNNAVTDSALYLLQKHVKEKLMSVAKPDKRQAVYFLTVIHENPELARVFAETMLNEVSGYYIEIMTKKARNNLAILQSEADSIKNIMNANLSSSALESDLNVNPMKQSLRVGQNRKMIDVQVSVTLYGEIIKNLKLAEISLRKQTPLIQVIDHPVMPLERSGYLLWQWIIIGMSLGAAFFIYLAYRSRNGATDSSQS